MYKIVMDYSNNNVLSTYLVKKEYIDDCGIHGYFKVWDSPYNFSDDLGYFPLEKMISLERVLETCVVE